MAERRTPPIHVAVAASLMCHVGTKYMKHLELLNLRLEARTITSIMHARSIDMLLL
jgi:hypothetical protein